MIKKECQLCKEEYKIWPCEKEINKYCSRMCTNKAHTTGRRSIEEDRKYRREYNNKLKKILIKKTCRQCLKIFFATARYKQKRFCSKVCVDKSIRKYPDYLICSTCKKEFFKKKHPETKYCSRKCQVNGDWGRKIGSWNIGRKLSQDTIRKIILKTRKGFKNGEPTSIEKKVYEELKSRGLLFETQKIIGNRFIVDAYIPSFNLVIEADGDYWHSLEKVKERDQRKNNYLTKNGYNLLRLTETEINNGSFKKRLPAN